VNSVISVFVNKLMLTFIDDAYPPCRQGRIQDFLE